MPAVGSPEWPAGSVDLYSAVYGSSLGQNETGSRRHRWSGHMMVRRHIDLDRDPSSSRENGILEVNNHVILCTSLAYLVTYLIYSIYIIVKRWWGGRTPLYILQWPPKSIRRTHPYLVTIATGFGAESSTRGKVLFALHGVDASTVNYQIDAGAAYLESHPRMLFGPGSRDCFLLLPEQPLGNIAHCTVTLWSPGRDDSWYLRYCTIEDVRRKSFWYLPLHEWISTRTSLAERRLSNFRHFLDNLLASLREQHIWIASYYSITLGSKIDSFFGATICYLTSASIMFLCALFFHTPVYQPDHDDFSASCFLYVFLTTLAVSAFVSGLQFTMRLVRVRSGEFVGRYTPQLLLQEESTSRHVHWGRDSEESYFEQEGESRKEEEADKEEESEESDWEDEDEDKATQNNNNNNNNNKTNNNNSAQRTGNGPPDLASIARGFCRRYRNPLMRSMDLRFTDEAGSGFESFQMNRNNNMLGLRFGAIPRSRMAGRTPSTVLKGNRSFSTISAIRENFCGTKRRRPGRIKFSAISRNNSSTLFTPLSYKLNPLRNDPGMMPDVSANTTSAAVSLPSRRTPCLKYSRLNYDTPFASVFSSRKLNGNTSMSNRYVYYTPPLNFTSNNYGTESYGKQLSKPSSSVFRIQMPPSTTCTTAPPTTYADHSLNLGRTPYQKSSEPKVFIPPRFFEESDLSVGDNRNSQTLVEALFSDGLNMSSNQRNSARDISRDRYYETKPASRGRATAAYNDSEYSVSGPPRRTHRRPVASRYDSQGYSFTPPCASGNSSAPDNHRRYYNDSWENGWRENEGDAYDRRRGSGGRSDGYRGGYDHRRPSHDPYPHDARDFAKNLVENVFTRARSHPDSSDASVSVTAYEPDFRNFVRKMSRCLLADEDPRKLSTFAGRGTCGATYSGGSPYRGCGRAGNQATNGFRCTDDISGGLMSSRLRESDMTTNDLVDQLSRELGLTECTSDRRSLRHGKVGTTSTLASRGSRKSRGSIGAGGISLSDSFKDFICGPRLVDSANDPMTPPESVNEEPPSPKKSVSQTTLDILRDKTKNLTEEELRRLATKCVMKLYGTVRQKLELMLRQEYNEAQDGVFGFPTDELLHKADNEVKEQVIPTLIEHIVWLVKEESKVFEQLDCDMMMIAFAGQYVDTIVTNAVLKTHADLNRSHAYTRTFILTAKSRKGSKGGKGKGKRNSIKHNNNNNNNSNNNNNNNMAVVLDECASSHLLSIHALTGVSATRCEVEDVLEQGDNFVPDEKSELTHRQIVVSVLKTLVRASEVRSQQEAPGGCEGADAGCPGCEEETVLSSIDSFRLPLSARLITSLVLEEAGKNLNECAGIVRSKMRSCSEVTMATLGRALLDGGASIDDHLMILESVAVDLRTIAMERAAEKVAEDILAVGDASKAELESELRRKVRLFLNTEPEMEDDTCRQQHHHNDDSEKEEVEQEDEENEKEEEEVEEEEEASYDDIDDGDEVIEENVNWNAMTSEAYPGESSQPHRRVRYQDPAADAASDWRMDAREEDAEQLINDLSRVRNSLMRIVRKDGRASGGRCRRHAANRDCGWSSNASGDDRYLVVGRPRRRRQLRLSELGGNNLSDLWADPRDAPFRLFGRLLLGIALLCLVAFGIGCVVAGSSLTASQAALWLQMVMVAGVVHVLVFEPFKVLLISLYWTFVRRALVM